MKKSALNEKHMTWSSLQEMMLCQMLLFNRRRAREVTNMHVIDYLRKKDPDKKSNI